MRWLAAALLAACQLATDFTLVPAAESSDLLCSDGKDNDFNGLTDCQEWSCLGELSCCDIPEVLLVDDFEYGPASCDGACEEVTCVDLACGPDEEAWHTWPCPFPRVCDGALRLDKDECFVPGVLSREPMSVTPGLLVEVDLLGAPERLGHQTISLTVQAPEDLPGAIEPCGRNQYITGFAALRQEWASEGYQVVAQFQSRDIAVSAPVTTPAELHTAAIGIDRDRRVFYALDGVTFAVADPPVPATSQEARLALSGLTHQAGFAAVRVQAGLRCHSPADWATAGATPEESVALMATNDIVGFDRDEVFHPAVKLVGDSVDLYYTGCRWDAKGGCDSLAIGVGRATAAVPGAPYLRDAANPLLIPDQIPSGAQSGVRTDFQLDLLDVPGDHGFVSPAASTALYRVDEIFGIEGLTLILELGTLGSWDNDDICCAASLERDGTTYLWYAGKPTNNDTIWRIGLATSTDGVHFVRHPQNPVLAEGPPGTFDAAGVNQPTVIYDERRGLYRMWYEGRDFFGNTSIGYAVSPDGVTWHRSPQNPVISGEELGFVTVGGPEVVLDPDGRLRMWLHATTATEFHRAIYVLENDGVLVEP